MHSACANIYHDHHCKHVSVHKIAQIKCTDVAQYILDMMMQPTQNKLPPSVEGARSVSSFASSHDKLPHQTSCRSHTTVTMPVDPVLKLQLQLQPLFRLDSTSVIIIEEGN